MYCKDLNCLWLCKRKKAGRGWLNTRKTMHSLLSNYSLKNWGKGMEELSLPLSCMNLRHQGSKIFSFEIQFFLFKWCQFNKSRSIQVWRCFGNVRGCCWRITTYRDGIEYTEILRSNLAISLLVTIQYNKNTTRSAVLGCWKYIMV